MIGIWKSYADVFLVVTGVVILIGFGIPLIFAPLRWARLFRWDVSQPSHLVIFLGRSMGVFVTVMGIFAIMVTREPAAMPFFFDMMMWLFVGMLLLHIYGAIRKEQPITETIEIAVWVILSLVTLGFYPVI